MPHAEVLGPCRVRDLAIPLSRIEESYSGGRLKVQAACLDAEERFLVLETIVIEGYLRQSFFLLVRQEEGGVVVRCHPFCTPQRTDGVKRAIARVARACLDQCAGSRIGNTNLTAYL